MILLHQICLEISQRVSNLYYFLELVLRTQSDDASHLFAVVIELNSLYVVCIKCTWGTSVLPALYSVGL
jgi:hypothetical protein